MNTRLWPASVLAAALLGGCVAVPTGPSVMVLPGDRKGFDEFQTDNAVCRQFALAEVGGVTPSQTSQHSTLQSAAVGTLIGGALGAAIDQGHGAAVGAASGLALGTVIGADAGAVSAYELQRRYDNAYLQCMYAHGNQVPVAGPLQGRRSRVYTYPPPPASRPGDYYYGPPPPDYPAPPH